MTTLFPAALSQFKKKTNANYNGDPIGDYVMAEDVNEIQEAINRLESFIGIEPNQKRTIQSRLKEISNTQEMKVPEISLINPYSSLKEETSTYQFGSKFNLVSIPYSTHSQTLIQELTKVNTDVYMSIDTNAVESTPGFIDTAAANAVAQGAKGVVLYQFGEMQAKRETENQILQAIRNRGIPIIIHSNKWDKLFSKEIANPYNVEGKSLYLDEGITLAIPNFAVYGGRSYFGDEMVAKMAPFLEAKIKSNVRLLGLSNVTKQEEYAYTNTYALIYSLDYLYFGLNEFSSSIPNYTYNFPRYVGQWKTTNPIVITENGNVTRIVKNGKLVLSEDLSYRLDGFRIQMQEIDWLLNTLDGKVIKDGTLNPSALSTYDVDRIIRLINANGTVKIDPKIIDAETGGALPVNIPWNNMKENVIEAINKKNDINSSITNQIVDQAIRNMNAKKLEGDLSKEQMQRNVVFAINDSPNRINVSYATIEELHNSITYSNLVNSEQVVTDRLNVTDTFTATHGEVSQDLVAHNIFSDYIKALLIEADVIRAKRLEVDDLQADNLKAVVIEAVTANIENGTFQRIVTQYLEADIIKTSLISAVNSMVGEAVISGALISEASIVDAQIVGLSANKIKAGIIDTGLVRVQGPDGHLVIKENSLNIYDEEDSSGNRRQRIRIGDVSDIVGRTDKYGLVVMGSDGKTVLYDETGVYNEGIKDNAISNTKLMEDSVDGRVIRAGSIFADHIISEAITSAKIKAGAITADKLAVNSIVAGSAVIADGAIGSAKISDLHGSKITAGSIFAKQLAAGSVTMDKLTVGYKVNKMRNGYDSFEQCLEGDTIGTKIKGAENSRVSSYLYFSGDKSLLVSGNSSDNIVLLDVSPLVSTHIIMGESIPHYVSAYAVADSKNQGSVQIGVRRYKSTGEYIDEWSQIYNTVKYEFIRPFLKVMPLKDYPYIEVMLRVRSSNVDIYFDGLQVEEEQEGMKEPSWWVSTETTKINGANINTGRIEARFLQIGSGTRFGDGHVITLSDKGINVAAKNGTATINDDGITIEGGAFRLNNQNKVLIDGNGVKVTSAKNILSINPDTGIYIQKRIDDSNIFYIDANGELFLKGRVEITQSNTVYTKSEVEEKIDTIDKRIEGYSNTLNKYAEASQIFIGIKPGFSSFYTEDPYSVFICKSALSLEKFGMELVNENGSITNWESSLKMEIPKQSINLRDTPKVQGYIVFNATDNRVSFVNFSENEIWVSYNYETPIHRKEFIFNESCYIVGEIDNR